MQFISFYIFTVICGCLLVSSAPTNQNSYEKVSAVANRLLKELANETLADQASEQDDDDIEYIPMIEESSSSSEINDFDDQELIGYLEEEAESDEDLIPVMHKPILDDSIMKGEDH